MQEVEAGIGVLYDEKERERKDCGRVGIEEKRSGRFRVELTGGVAIVGGVEGSSWSECQSARARPGLLSGREEPRGEAQAIERVEKGPGRLEVVR